MTATARTLAALPDDARRNVLAGLTSAELQSLEFSWSFWARRDRLPPDPALWPLWRTWLLLGGRGSGKTRAAAEWVRAEIEAGRRRQIGIIAPTADTLRRICVEGPSGLLMTSPDWNRRGDSRSKPDRARCTGRHDPRRDRCATFHVLKTPVSFIGLSSSRRITVFLEANIEA